MSIRAILEASVMLSVRVLAQNHKYLPKSQSDPETSKWQGECLSLALTVYLDRRCQYSQSRRRRAHQSTSSGVVPRDLYS